MSTLHMLVDKLSAEYRDIGYKYCEKSFYQVNITRIDFDVYSGKCKHLHTVDEKKE